MCHLVDVIEAYLRAKNSSFSRGLELLEMAFGRPGELSRYKYAPMIPNKARTELREQLAGAIRLLSSTQSSAEDLLEEINDQADQVHPKVIETKAALKRVYKRSSFVHAAMVQEAFGAADQAKLFAFAKEMMEDIQPQINHYYEIIGTYEKTGRVIGQSSLEADRAVELTKRINSLRSSISRYRRLARECSDDLKKMDYQRKLDERQKRLDQAQLELKNI